jgi:uncharacterized protein (TIGR00299 family) protein
MPHFENKILFFDCFSGASGDMILGALIDAGASFEALSEQIKSLKIDGYSISRQKKKSSGISATKFIVNIEKDQPERNFSDIKDLIARSGLSDFVKEKSIETFRIIAESEALIHGNEPDLIHFHEIGAVDSIIDIAGSFIGIENLGMPSCSSSPVPVSCGEIKTQHGTLPLPAPATAGILRNVPVVSAPESFEYVTPTGASILKAICEKFGSFPPMNIRKIGYGAGDREFEGRPNILRVFLGERRESFSGFFQNISESKEILIEVNLDNMNPETYPYVMRKLYEAGSLDVWLTPVVMKKGRPGNVISIIAPESSLENLAEVLFSETSTIGLRFQAIDRIKLDYKIMEFQSSLGLCRIKVAFLKDKTIQVAPEYEDCASIAEKTGMSLIQVRRKILEEFLNKT